MEASELSREQVERLARAMACAWADGVDGAEPEDAGDYFQHQAAEVAPVVAAMLDQARAEEKARADLAWSVHAEHVERMNRLLLQETAVAEERGRAEEREKIQRGRGGGWWTLARWQDWSDELAALIPDGDEAKYSNPEGAQEAIILDCLRAYVAALTSHRVIDTKQLRS